MSWKAVVTIWTYRYCNFILILVWPVLVAVHVCTFLRGCVNEGWFLVAIFFMYLCAVWIQSDGVICVWCQWGGGAYHHMPHWLDDVDFCLIESIWTLFMFALMICISQYSNSIEVYLFCYMMWNSLSDANMFVTVEKYASRILRANHDAGRRNGKIF
jgi:hypothetical protein